MKNCKKRNASFGSRIFGIILVTMLTSTTLWAKPKVEYTPFKSENPNATVFECEYIPGYSSYSTRLYFCYRPDSLNDSYMGYEVIEAFKKEAFKSSSIAIYGWKKRKGGWEKLWEYQLSDNSISRGISEKISDYGSDQYTHYAVEIEVMENSVAFQAKNDGGMQLHLGISKDYKKRIDEKREAERAEKERLAAEEKAKQNAARDAKGKEIAKGYVYHGRDEASRNAKLFAGGALEEGHAYYISNYIAGSHETGAAYMGSYPDYHLVEYASPKVKAEAVTRTSYEYNSWLRDYIGSTVPVVVAGKKRRPIVLGIVDID